jgi:hypothetical protein
MPEVFNLTVRATAASGAFADRAFSITVNNTLIQRLLAVGQEGAARSLGAGQPWVLIPNVKGDSADYGDRWLVWDQTASVMWSAPDLINWTSFAPTLPTGYTTLSFLRWRAGAWWAVGENGTVIAVLRSTDGGRTWAIQGATLPGAGLLSFERSEAGVSVVAFDTEWYQRASDGVAWVSARTATTMDIHKFQIAHLNGVWFAPEAYLPDKMMRSADGAAWFSQSNTTTVSGYARGAAYANGVVLTHNYTSPQMVSSTDGGQTFQPLSLLLPAASAAYQSERYIVAQGGRFVLLGASGNTYAVNSVTTPVTTQALPAPMSVPACLAVRLS